MSIWAAGNLHFASERWVLSVFLSEQMETNLQRLKSRSTAEIVHDNGRPYGRKAERMHELKARDGCALTALSFASQCL